MRPALLYWLFILGAPIVVAGAWSEHWWFSLAGVVVQILVLVDEIAALNRKLRSAEQAQLATTLDIDGILHRLARLDGMHKPEGDVLEFVKLRDASGPKPPKDAA